jgi:hypothetical protein
LFTLLLYHSFVLMSIYFFLVSPTLSRIHHRILPYPPYQWQEIYYTKIQGHTSFISFSYKVMANFWPKKHLYHNYTITNFSIYMPIHTHYYRKYRLFFPQHRAGCQLDGGQAFPPTATVVYFLLMSLIAISLFSHASPPKIERTNNFSLGLIPAVHRSHFIKHQLVMPP